jgi:hypothetical protein
LLHACLGLGPFLSFEQLSTAMLIRSTPVADRMTAGLALEAGLRAALPVESVPLGAGIRIRWRVFQATIKQTGDPFTERNSLDLEFFIFSEG